MPSMPNSNFYVLLDSIAGTPVDRRRISKRSRVTTGKKKSGDLYYPDLARWPDVPKKKISKLSHKILDIFVSLFFFVM